MCRPTLEQLFRTPPYNTNPPFKQMPGNLGYTELHFFCAPEEPMLQRSPTPTRTRTPTLSEVSKVCMAH